MKKLVKIVSVIFIIVLLVNFSNIVYADMGPKPSITIHLKNMDNSNYYVDLLVDSKGDDDFINIFSPWNNNVNKSYKKEPIYNYNDNGWVAAATRVAELWGDVVGNDKYTNDFSYMGVPDTFKVIVQLSDGTIKTTKTLKRNQLNYECTVDIKTMGVKENTSPTKMLLPLIITIVVEIVIALIMKTKHIFEIFLSNMLTNITFQFYCQNLFSNNYIMFFIIGEICVTLVEYFIYKKIMKDVPNKKIVLYTIVANLITALITFVI